MNEGGMGMSTYHMQMTYWCEKQKIQEDKRQEKMCDSRYQC